MFHYYSKLAWLSIKRTPMLTALMILAIALGIGVSMTVLTVNYLMGKDPIPSKSNQLYHVQLFSYGNNWKNEASIDNFPWQMTYQDNVNIKRSEIPIRNTRSLPTGFTVIPDSPDKPPYLETARAIDSDFFAMFNISFIHGSSWDKTIDEQPENIVVISRELNDELFKGENSVGRQLNLDLISYRIIGIIEDWQPALRFYDLNAGGFNSSERVFVPFSLLPVNELRNWGNNSSWKDEPINSYQDKLQSEIFWTQHWVELLNQEQKEKYQTWLAGYIAEQQKAGRFADKRAAASLKNVLEWMDYNQVVSDDSSILVGLAFMFLAVCMINTIGLLLAKFLRRAPEIGVRRALGASRGEIFTQHLVDVGFIGLTGGLLGILLGQLGLLGVRNLYSSYKQLVDMDITLVIIAILISLGASILSGLYPAWKICRTNPSVYLKIQ